MEDKKQGDSNDHVIVVNRHNSNFTEDSLYSMICNTLLAQNHLEIIQEQPKEYPNSLKIVWRLKEETQQTIPYDMKWNPDCKDCLPEGINDCIDCHKREEGEVK